ncbi:MAG: hypothetical protein H6707_04665 [Deltaproteobacteria bacterium]|nr:hypothetical protein [Deltaproteobacteria bacterium]
MGQGQSNAAIRIESLERPRTPGQRRRWRDRISQVIRLRPSAPPPLPGGVLEEDDQSAPLVELVARATGRPVVPPKPTPTFADLDAIIEDYKR